LTVTPGKKEFVMRFGFLVGFLSCVVTLSLLAWTRPAEGC